MFFKKKQPTPTESPPDFNPSTHRAVIKCSICNGEQVAGFKDKQTGHFTEVMFIRDASDLLEFKRRYGLENVPKEY